MPHGIAFALKLGFFERANQACLLKTNQADG
jgi:hypothetical protein